MPNRTLSPNELLNANALLVEVRARLKALAGGNSALLFAYRRKIYKELTYDERTPRIHGRQYETALPRMRHRDSGSTRVQVSRGDDSRRGGTERGSCPWPGETVTRCRPGPPAELGLGTVNRSAVIAPAGTGA